LPKFRNVKIEVLELYFLNSRDQDKPYLLKLDIDRTWLWFIWTDFYSWEFTNGKNFCFLYL